MVARAEMAEKRKSRGKPVNNGIASALAVPWLGTLDDIIDFSPLSPPFRAPPLLRNVVTADLRVGVACYIARAAQKRRRHGVTFA